MGRVLRQVLRSVLHALGVRLVHSVDVEQIEGGRRGRHRFSWFAVGGKDVVCVWVGVRLLSRTYMCPRIPPTPGLIPARAEEHPSLTKVRPRIAFRRDEVARDEADRASNT